MRKQEILRFKKLIENKINELSGKSYDLNVDDKGDEIDAAQSCFLVDMAYTNRNRSAETINRLNYALEKIDEGVFGICEECDEEIPIKRLEICLDAKHCIRCAELIEKNTRSFRRK